MQNESTQITGTEKLIAQSTFSMISLALPHQATYGKQKHSQSQNLVAFTQRDMDQNLYVLLHLTTVQKSCNGGRNFNKNSLKLEQKSI